MHKLVMLATAAVAAMAPAIAHADHDLSRPMRLAEVSADPRDGNDTVRLRDLSRFTHLELRAREASVRIRDLGLRFHDGRVEWLDVHARIAPGEQRTIELPPMARRAESIVVDYGDPELRRRDRTPARLELYGATAEERSGGWYGERYGERLDDRRRADRWERRSRYLAPNDGWR